MNALTWIVRSRKMGQDYAFFTPASSTADAERIFRASHPAWPVLSVKRQVTKTSTSNDWRDARAA
jgi:hypothetical protein